MVEIPFESAVPDRYLWVSATAPDGGTGTKDSPLNNIQTAIAKAKPGTAIMVQAGDYFTNVLVKRTADGTPDKPIWLISADGPGAAHIISQSDKLPAIGGGGVENFIVDGFMTIGGKNGIHFGQNGGDYTDMVSNIVVRNNIIIDPVEDGVKANGGSGFYVLNNTIVGGSDEGIDFVAIRGGVISGNEVSGNTGTSAGIFAKFGSDDILISNNYVHDNAAVGISVGGYVNPNTPMYTGYDTFQARNVIVQDNIIVDNGRVPLTVFGSQAVTVTNNIMSANPNYYTGLFVGSSNPTMYGTFTSSDVTIADNVLTDFRRPYTVADGSSANFVNNGPDVEVDTSGMSFYGKYMGIVPEPAAPQASIEPPQVNVADLVPVTIEPSALPAEPDEDKAAASDVVDMIPTSDSGVATAKDTFKLISLSELFTKEWPTSASPKSTVKDGQGTSGNDELVGSTNQYAGGEGDDTYVVGQHKLDLIVETAGGGTDTLLAKGSYAYLPDHLENLTFTQAKGAVLIGNSGDNRITGNAGNDIIDGKAGGNLLTGGLGADRFIVDTEAGLTRITDFGSDDTIHIVGLSAGSFEQLKTEMTEYQGATVLVLDDGRSVIFDNMKIADFTAAQFTLQDNSAPAQMGNYETKVIAANANTMVAKGNEGANTLLGDGQSILIGGDGDDRYILRTPGDKIIEDAHGGQDLAVVNFQTYVADAGVENVVMRYDGDAHVTGNGLANIIEGGDGNDLIDGSGGADLLTGSKGADTFVYHAVSDGGDIITDFEIGVDHLDFDDLRSAHPEAAFSVVDTTAGLAVYASLDGIDTLMVTLENVHQIVSMGSLELLA